MSQTRDKVLATIRRHTQKQEPHPDLTTLQAITFDNKLEQFVQVVGTVGGKALVLEHDSKSTAELVRELHPEAKRFISELNIEGLPCVHPENIATAGEMNGTDVVIVSSPLGVCENGCVWVEQKTRLRAQLFISEHLIVLLDRNTLVNNMHEAYRKVREFAPSTPFSGFISGPSKTADIEQALVMGAHGARSLTVLIR